MSASLEQRAWELLRAVPDPEIPVVSIVDLGIVRYVQQAADGRLHVGLTPTYCACPATQVIRADAQAALTAAGIAHAVVEEVLAPPWTSDWVTDEGRAKLQAYGIAPPDAAGAAEAACPRCASRATEKISEFGSTPCKAHYRCLSCGEPFDRFKCI